MSIDETFVNGSKRNRRELRLSAREVRGLYYLKEQHVEEILDAAILLEEHERKLAVRMLRSIVEHRRSMLS